MTKDKTLRLALEALKSIFASTHPYRENGTCTINDESVELSNKAISAIEAALEAKDEPVAWMYEVNHAHTCLDLFEPPDDAYDEGTLYPLYTTPPQRTWVGLMRGVRVEGDTVVIAVKGGNDAARELCGYLLNEIEVRRGND